MDIRHKVSRRAKLTTIGFACFLASLIGLHALTSPHPPSWLPKELSRSWAVPALALISFILGILVVRGVVATLADGMSANLGAARARSMKSILSIALYIVLVLSVASVTQIDLTGIALSGAVTGIVIGIAGQASIANVIAGLVILSTRPFRSGQYVTVRAAAFAGSEYSGEVGEITLFYTTLFAGRQEIRVPNSSMITSVVTLRTQAIDVYFPVTLPASRSEVLSTTELSRRLASTLPPGRDVSAAIESVEDGNVHIGVRASVASEDERSKLENAVVTLLDPVPSQDKTGPMTHDS